MVLSFTLIAAEMLDVVLSEEVSTIPPLPRCCLPACPAELLQYFVSVLGATGWGSEEGRFALTSGSHGDP